MKPIQLHPASLLVGAGAMLLAVVAMGQQVLPNRGTYEEELRRQPKFMVHPRDYVQIKEGVPFTVPAGKILVVKALGGTRGGLNYVWYSILHVDGVQEVVAPSTTFDYGYSAGIPTFGEGVSMKSLPFGLSVAEGAIVDVTGADPGDPDDARAWGYLADA